MAYLDCNAGRRSLYGTPLSPLLSLPLACAFFESGAIPQGACAALHASSLNNISSVLSEIECDSAIVAKDL
jgi:hypothetical protein